MVMAARPPERNGAGGRLTGGPALRLHLTLVFVLALCSAAFCIELLRALGGNELSWLYVFEWPLFAGFSVYMWWNLLHERHGATPRSTHEARRGSEVKPADRLADGLTVTGPADDARLHAWNSYVRDLEESDARQELDQQR